MIKKLKIIATIYTDFPEKFGIPRQSGLVSDLTAKIVFEPEYRNAEALRGMEEFSHIWLLWDFSLVNKEAWSPTVYPPRLGGKEKRGVFATRSPFRPNSIGLSSVKLERMEEDPELGMVLVVSGADLMNGTPIYDIKPYLPYTDSHPEARGGFGEAHKEDSIEVDFPAELLGILPEEKRKAAFEVLAQDPRAAYNKKPDYVYGMQFSGFDIRFTVVDNCLHVKEVIAVDRQNFHKIK